MRYHNRHIVGLSALCLILFALLVNWLTHEEPANLPPVPYLRAPVPAVVDSALSSMTLEEKIGQLILLEWTASDTAAHRRLDRWVSQGYIGGLLPKGIPARDFRPFVKRHQAKAPWPLFVATREEILINQQLDALPPLPDLSILTATGNDSLLQHLRSLYGRQARHLGINLSLGIRWAADQRSGAERFQSGRIDQLTRHRILAAAPDFDAYFPDLTDSLPEIYAVLRDVRQRISEGLSGIVVPARKLDICGSWGAEFHTYLTQQIGFDGLIWGQWDPYTRAACLVHAGLDAVVVQEDPEGVYQDLLALAQQGVLSEEALDRRVRKILRAKYWMHNGLNAQALNQDRPDASPFLKAALPAQPAPEVGFTRYRDPLYDHFRADHWQFFRERVDVMASTLLHVGPASFPISTAVPTRLEVLDFCRIPAVHLPNRLQKFLPVVHRMGRFHPEEGFTTLPQKDYRPVVVFDRGHLDPRRDSAFLAALRRQDAILINLGDPKGWAQLDTSGLTLLQGYSPERHVQEAMAEILVGAQAVSGILPYTVNKYLKAGDGIFRPAIRLGFSDPEEVGIRGERLVSIDAILSQAVRAGAFPGAQVLIARQGRIIYRKAFGQHTYQGPELGEKDLYDIASVTKVAATTLGIMRAYEAGLIDLDDRIWDHLPALRTRRWRSVTIERLLTHRSGVQPNLPVGRYLVHGQTRQTDCDSIFCHTPDPGFSVQVARDVYFSNHLRDSVFSDLRRMQVRRGQRFRYSDANFVLLQKLLERKTGEPLDQWLNRVYYHPMGLTHTLYNPLTRWSAEHIVPTEKEGLWRRQLLHGYVHDPTAALLGGVAGHAGLFSNMDDLAALMQMLLNGGRYGGVRYLQPETIRTFTTARYGNHRGLGFDKPHHSNAFARARDMSEEGYGHMGFTGTCIWVDPQHDLLYIFLSNRVHPNVRNYRINRMAVRSRIHQVVYDALGTYRADWPDLPGLDLPPPLLAYRINPS